MDERDLTDSLRRFLLSTLLSDHSRAVFHLHSCLQSQILPIGTATRYWVGSCSVCHVFK